MKKEIRIKNREECKKHNTHTPDFSKAKMIHKDFSGAYVAIPCMNCQMVFRATGNFYVEGKHLLEEKENE